MGHPGLVQRVQGLGDARADAPRPRGVEGRGQGREVRPVDPLVDEVRVAVLVFPEVEDLKRAQVEAEIRCF